MKTKLNLYLDIETIELMRKLSRELFGTVNLSMLVAFLVKQKCKDIPVELKKVFD